jgi:hypothetical protein
VASGKNETQKTIEITINRGQLQFKDRQELMTSLSKIILGEEAIPEDFNFEILLESSILGD